MKVRSKVFKGSKDRKGRIRKFISIPDTYYDDFEFGEVVDINKLAKDESEQGSG